jgi:hypothetical protein
MKIDIQMERPGLLDPLDLLVTPEKMDKMVKKGQLAKLDPSDLLDPSEQQD